MHDGPDMRGEDTTTTYERHARALRDEARPCAFVDVDAFDRNVDMLFRIATAHGKSLRIATKSVRCPDLLRRIVARTKARATSDPRVSLMTYTARETAFLYAEGFDDFLLAYPCGSRKAADLVAGLARKGACVSVVVDDTAHLEALDAAAVAADTRISIVVEVDMAYRPAGDRLHLGVRRSPLRALADVLAFVDGIGRFQALHFFGIMGYEAQIAGLGDSLVNARAKSTFVRALRGLSRRDVEGTRAELVSALSERGKRPTVVNGGGTGNLTWCAREPALTEVTAGSGFLCSHLFDRYREVRPEPAAYFALDVVRRPGLGFVTCMGGGYVASGPAGVDRLPLPALPSGLSLLPIEGAGEVQTPLYVPIASNLRVGDPVFFRHAKAGELAEHFAEYLLVQHDEIVGRAKTYRGSGHCFSG